MRNVIITFFVLLLAGQQTISAQNPDEIIVELTIQNDGNNAGSNEMPLTPVQPPQVSISGHTIYFTGTHNGFTLDLLDENNIVAYHTTVASGVTEVILPDYISGNYTLRLTIGSSVFIGEITV